MPPDHSLAAKTMAKKALTFDTPFDSYQVTSVLGEGGAGRVYAVINSSGEMFALKCLSPGRVTSERLRRFKNEIGFCQRTSHKNILRIDDTGLAEVEGAKVPFYVMKRYEGTLRTRMVSLGANDVLHVFALILDGVEAAHLLNVWHRDIKPENVLCNNIGNELVIADFGIVHFEEEEIYTAVETKVASRMANFQYSAPEQRVRGTKIDHRADIFSLGLLLNEMFTREIPQGAGYKRIASVSPDNAYLDDLVELMIQQNPSNRPESIGEIKRELIGRKNRFIAEQKLDAKTKQVVVATAPAGFTPISIVALDYSNGTLSLALSDTPPPGWAQEFHHPRGGHSSIMG